MDDRDERSDRPQGEVDPVPDVKVEADISTINETVLDIFPSSTLSLYYASSSTCQFFIFTYFLMAYASISYFSLVRFKNASTL